MRRLSRFFNRLRWKLTLAFAGIITAGFILLILGWSAVMSLDRARNSEWLGTDLGAWTRELAEQLEDDLKADPPRLDAVREKLDAFAASKGNITGQDFALTELGPENIGILAVVDREDRVLVAYPTGSPPVGDAIRDYLAPTGIKVLEAMVLGKTPLPLPGLRDPETRNVFIVAPIRIGADLRVADVDLSDYLGAVVLRYDPVLTDAVVGLGVMIPAMLSQFIWPSAVIGLVLGFLTAGWFTRRLRRFSEPAEAWGRGDFAPRIQDHSRDEVGQLGQRLNRMADDLEDLLQTREELATVDERNRVARELHDSVKQQVFAAAMQLGAARGLVKNESAGALEPLARAEHLTLDAGRELTRLIRELRPVALDGKGLAAALRDYAERWSRDTGIAVAVRVRGERSTPVQLEQELFRVAQEALGNVEQHSAARRVELELAWSTDEIRLEVLDDGTGFEPDQAPRGWGLLNMRERVASLGGRFRIESGPDRGTRVTAACPVVDDG